MADDIAPLEVVGCTLSDEDSLGSTRAVVVFLVGSGEQSIWIVKLLIAAEVGCFGFIQRALYAAVGSDFIDATAVGRNHACESRTSELGIGFGIFLGFLASDNQVAMVVEVSYLCYTFELDVGIVDADEFLALGRVVESYCASSAFASLYIFDKDECAVGSIVFGNIGLKSERVLVEGDEFLVA